MNKRRFERILGAFWYNKTKAPRYKDRFWPVREMIVERNANMERSFAPGWVSCLDEFMLPRTNKYTCPGQMCVPRKPWPVGNKYHSICSCMSGIMYAVEIVEGKDHPPQKPKEKFADVTKKWINYSITT